MKAGKIVQRQFTEFSQAKAQVKSLFNVSNVQKMQSVTYKANRRIGARVVHEIVETVECVEQYVLVLFFRA